jgi:hypothetical protein
VSRSIGIILRLGAVLFLLGFGCDRPAGIGGQTMRVDEAIARGIRGEVRLLGFLVGRSQGPIRLCAELLESYPPQCGGPSILVEGLGSEALGRLTHAEGVVWSDAEVELSGTLDNGVLKASGRDA